MGKINEIFSEEGFFADIFGEYNKKFNLLCLDLINDYEAYVKDLKKIGVDVEKNNQFRKNINKLGKSFYDERNEKIDYCKKNQKRLLAILKKLGTERDSKNINLDLTQTRDFIEEIVETAIEICESFKKDQEKYRKCAENLISVSLIYKEKGPQGDPRRDFPPHLLNETWIINKNPK